MTYWLRYSSEELRQARTCQGCGCHDADIDIGLCFECFQSRRNGQNRLRDDERAEREYYEQQEAEYYASLVADGSHI